MSSRIRTGSVVQDKRSKVWNFFWWENGKGKCKVLGRFPHKASAWKAARPLRDEKETKTILTCPRIGELVPQYRIEKMPQRASTRRGYEVYLQKHILPKWQDAELTELQARPVELWLQSLDLAPKSKVHIRGLLRVLWDYRMWPGAAPTPRHPTEPPQTTNRPNRPPNPTTSTIQP